MIFLIPIHFCHFTYNAKMKGICEGITLVGCSFSYLISFNTCINYYTQDRKLFPQKKSGKRTTYIVCTCSLQFGLF